MISIRNTRYPQYEQDIRELLMAFFPGEPMTFGEVPEAAFVLDADKLEPKTFGSRSEDRSSFKRSLYLMLSGATGRKLPWGTLTGIRPVRLADAMFDKGMSADEVSSALEERYLISAEKRGLMIRTALREREVLRGIDYRNGWSLYIGIAFCPTTCMYCSFTSYPVEKWKSRIDEYLDCIEKELRQLRETEETPGSCLYGKKLQTIYIGGGTPTTLEPYQLERLLSSVENILDLSGLYEFTVEAGRPDSITAEKLEIIKKHGIGRICVNPQSFCQKTLDLIGRKHTAEDTVDAYRLASSMGFENINMDIIMGLPGEDIDDVRHTLSVIKELRPAGLTVHSLAVKRAARLNIEGNAWGSIVRAGIGANGPEEAYAMMDAGAETAESLGLLPYYLYRQKNMAGNQENVGYALPGCENLYNILMMEEKHSVIGCGAGSSSKLVIRNDDPSLHDGNEYRVERLEDMKSIGDYLSRIDGLLEKRRAFFGGKE